MGRAEPPRRRAIPELETIAVLPPSAPQKPWLGERDLGKPPRIFADLTARTYNDDRATAAAVRAIGAAAPAASPPRGRGALARVPRSTLAAFVAGR